jgi:hypothetical protein
MSPLAEQDLIFNMSFILLATWYICQCNEKQIVLYVTWCICQCNEKQIVLSLAQGTSECFFKCDTNIQR